MRLKCPNCGAQYEISEDVIPDQGRDVQCSNCGHTWFQGPDALGHEDDEEVVEDAEVQAETTETDNEDDHDTVAEDSDDDEDGPPPGRPAPKRRELPEEIASVLRQEAEFEVRARDATPEPIETQPDLGLVAGSAEAKSVTAPVIGSAIAAGLSDDKPAEDLPDINDINSTLIAQAPPATQTADAEQAKGGFGKGFLTVVAIGAVALALYAYAPQISQSVPGLSAAMEGYSDTIDGLRLWIDGTLQQVVAS
ncbi:zinc-ribbon domain-containing protein [Pseudaestuariivita rosea]|uniref:zinc-ribbon domain-containing protein n=1 Tax=Pseudaestuariivita rosea TaxID=2763263 RepID=UPI001ABB7EE4|nr:zinc-ribbon domain-containing protein [Pseudaestuariivita rosea]